MSEEKKDKENLKKKLSECEKKLNEYKKKAEEYLNGWKRAKADYLNFKKEEERRKSEFVKFANLSLILELLPLRENFKKAFNHLPKELEENDWVIGIKHIKNQIDELFKKFHIEEIKTVGEKFNPERHEAVGKEKRDNLEEDTIIKEVETGYLMEGKVIKPAKVIISYH